MSPSWSIRHPFASSSSSTSQSQAQSGQASRDRRTSSGYGEQDLLPPIGTRHGQRDSGRFSDAAGDETMDYSQASGEHGESTIRQAGRPPAAPSGGDSGYSSQSGMRMDDPMDDFGAGSSRTRYTQTQPGRPDQYAQPATLPSSTSRGYSQQASSSQTRPSQSATPSRKYSAEATPPSHSLSPSYSFPHALDAQSQYLQQQGYGEPVRDRLPHSSSQTSMSASLRGKRAPAPAALDLSPKADRRKESAVSQGEEGYSNLGLGMPQVLEGQGRRVVTDSSIKDSQHRSRPLPQPPSNPSRRQDESMRSTSMPYSPSFPPVANPYRPTQSYGQHRRQDSGTGQGRQSIPASPSMPLNVPLSAVGQMDRRELERRQSNSTLGTRVGQSRPSIDTTRIDSYYLGTYPQSPQGEPLTPTMPSTSFGPVTPGVPDPRTLDRRGLVGTGELATPRWTTTTSHQHMRTPSMPSVFGVGNEPTVPLPNTANPSSQKNWSQGASGYGLGVGVMEGVKEESPQRKMASGARARSMSQQAPPHRVPETSTDRYPTGSSTLSRSKGAEASNLLDLGDFGDFQFDSSMAAAIAASLSIPDASGAQEQPQAEQETESQGDYRFPDGLRSAPSPPAPVQRNDTDFSQSYQPQYQQQSQQQNLQPGIPISPGSARARIYARRNEREKRASMLSQANSSQYQPPLPPAPLQAGAIPQRSSSKYTPPNSAHSSEGQGYGPRSTRDARKTPPAGAARDTAPRAKHSPSSSHDILKHFAPRDFSHLPPSPSSASINQFLKASSSINNFSSVTSPGVKTPPATSMSGGYFPTSPGGPPMPMPVAQPTPQKGGVQRSDSQRSQKLKNLAAGRGQKEGWEMDAETAEAMRKLDGLGGTPGRSKSAGKSKLSSGPPRPATPPTVRKEEKGKGTMMPPQDRRLTEKSSYGSLRGAALSDAGSPLTDWAQLGAEEAAPSSFGSRSKTVNGAPVSQLERPHVPVEPRESSSSPSFVGTPTSRDSLQTSVTTPPSTAGVREGKGRRASGGSEASMDNGPGANGSYEKVGEVTVPPVPPLPKGYFSMRQGLAQAAAAPAPSYVPLQDAQTDQVSPVGTPPSDPARPKPNKKWSFSSAMSLKLNKDAGSPSQATPSPPVRSDDSPDAGWSEVNYADFAPPPTGPVLSRLDSDTSSYATARQDTRSKSSNTSVGTLAPPLSALPRYPSTSSNKRLTPSGIPFFRRTSSSSLQPSASTSAVPDAPKTSMPPPSKIPTAPASNTRKSMLGMHLPSMLRGSTSKRHLSQQLETQPENKEVVEIRAELPEKAATTGWKGRHRGNTMSISGPLQPRKTSLAPDHYQTSNDKNSFSKNQASIDGSLGQRQGSSTTPSEATQYGSQTLRPSRSGYPTTSNTPSIRAVPSSGSLRAGENRAPPSSTPTKIPRLVNRDSDSPAGRTSMGPPVMPHSQSISRMPQAGPVAHSKTMSSTATMERSGVSEFGAVGGMRPVPSNDPQRSRLLAPMSMRHEPKQRMFAKPIETAVRNDRPSNIPPSRRNMPLAAPRPTATGMTISAQNKRSSRDVVPGMSRTSSKESGRESSSDNSNPNLIKPSKSLHSNLVAVPPPLGTRIPSSSSVGAPGLSYRKTSLVSDSPADSPADDEETLADAEMMAYVERRKARVAAGSKKDDLADVEDFPDDIQPAEPQSQRAFISKNLSSLSDFERKEVLDYDRIYYAPSKRIVREPQNGAIYNHGYDDERGDYLVVDGDHMCYRYEVIKILGKGSFGQVAQCRDHMTGGSVAVKIIRNKKRFHSQALVEVKILGQLVDWDPEDKHHMVRMTDHFYFRSHLCIVTELLSINLYELIKANQFAGFSTTVIRRFTTQMLASMQLMRSHRIVHCDLKPENILLMHPCKAGIKVIDFGSSCHETEKVYTYIQSRFYRSPEVILGMNYAMAIDMWSLGCILAELYTGVPIFPGENEHEQLACIMEVLGVPDKDIVNRAQRKKLFFDATGAPRPFVSAKGKRRRPSSRTLAQVLKSKDELFVDFISKCLTWDPDRRLKPQPAMRHPWILQGKRRYAPAPPVTMPSRGSESSNYPAPPRTTLATSQTKSNEKKQLVISPPTPLVARVAQVPASAPRAGGAPSSSRLPQSVSHRNSAYMSSTKVGY